MHSGMNLFRMMNVGNWLVNFSTRLLTKHQLIHLILVFFFFFQIEHGAKYTVPKSRAHTKAHVLIFIMMQVMIAP